MTVLLTRCGHRRAYHRGVAAHVAGDHAGALRIFRELARRGYAPAQFLLGSMYHKGEGVDTDPDEALVNYLVAAVQGHPQVLLDLLQAFASSARRIQSKAPAGVRSGAMKLMN